MNDIPKYILVLVCTASFDKIVLFNPLPGIVHVVKLYLRVDRLDDGPDGPDEVPAEAELDNFLVQFRNTVLVQKSNQYHWMKSFQIQPL